MLGSISLSSFAVCNPFVNESQKSKIIRLGSSSAAFDMASATEMLPLALPVVAGVKVTFRVTICPGVRVVLELTPVAR